MSRHPFQETRRLRRPPDPLLEELVAAIDTTAIHEEPIHDEAMFVFGAHDPIDGSVRINIGLLRLVVTLHELVHKARPTWSETAVRAKTTRLLQSLTDDDIAALDRRVRGAVRRTKASTRSALGPPASRRTTTAR